MSQILSLSERVKNAAKFGMVPSLWAELQPDKEAVREASGRAMNFGDLNDKANRVARVLREAGVKDGDGVAIISSNRLELAEVLLGAGRIGARLTPVNWHLTPPEIAYIVQNCEAKALFSDASLSGMEETAAHCGALNLKLAIGGDIPGFESYEEALGAASGSDIDRPSRGYTMLYTSGTTGRPKGVYKPLAPDPEFLDYDRSKVVHLCTGPGYHGAPLLQNIKRPLFNGVGTVLLDKWNSETVLQLIDQCGVTHTHMVAIMFQRLLSLSPDVRARYEISSLEAVTHGAAPCPPEVKRAMIEWIGPVINEYYAGSEGDVGFMISSEEWLAKPGSVGRKPYPDAAKILDDEGQECSRNVSGNVYMKLPEDGGFVYFKDPDKTDANRQNGYFTLGDIGYFDVDDYLFLTGRSAEVIISGGVNIYPQEIDNELIKHPGVEDSCTVGIPNEEWGEEVRAVIKLRSGYEASDDLRQDILNFAAANLARFKIPRGLDFVDDLPRSQAGKAQRNRVRAVYWEGRSISI